LLRNWNEDKGSRRKEKKNSVVLEALTFSLFPLTFSLKRRFATNEAIMK